MEDSTTPAGSPVAATELEQSPPNITAQALPAAENSEPEQVLPSPPAEEKFAREKDEEEVNTVAELSKEEVPAPEPSEAYVSELPEASASEPPTLEAPSASELLEPSAPAPADEVSEPPAPALAPADEVSETPASVPVDEVSETPASVPADEVSEIPVSVPADEVSKDPAPAPESEASEPTAPASVNGNGNVTEANVEAVNRHTAPEVVVLEKPQEKKEEDSMPPEVDSVAVPPHWHAKPCLHVTSIGGFVSQEELSSMFSEFGKISSIVFENERKEAAIIRYETATAEGEELVAKAKEKLQNAQLDDRSLRIEAFRSDSLLFIGNLTPDIDDEMLRKMFEQHGTIERAFVLRNAAGRSKRYGFVEYSLKSQALTAKMAMGNINMDGRVLRVEWSDCKKIADMFSTVLFVDRIPKENPNVEASLRSLFGQYGKVRDCHLAIGMSNQFRGFGFIDFYHSLCADMAHQALDGHELEGHSIRVSFANPTKSAQSYKMRFGSQPAPAPAPYGHGGRGVHPGMMGNAPVRGHMPMHTPSSGQRFMGHGRTGMMGMGIGMQFGRGSHAGQALHDHGHPGGGTGMLGAGAAPAGMMGRPPLMNSLPARRGMAAGATLAPIPRLPGQGHSSINPATIAQVASAQAKAREVKAREEYYQNQPQQSVDNAFKQGDSQYGYQQQYHQQTQQQQTTVHTQYQQQLGLNTQQPYTQYYSQPAQSYIPSQQPQQQQQGQYSQSAQYYQQQPAQQELAVQPQSYAYVQPYAQQYGQQYGAPAQHQYSQPYNQPASQISTQQYQQAAQPQVQAQYNQSYNQPTPQNSAPQYQQINAAAPVANAGAGILTAQSQDGSQQAAYAAYYNQQQPQPQPQLQPQTQQNVAQVASGAAQTSNVVGTSQQSLEAQWAAYYASQAAYQQAASYPQQQQQQQPQVATSYNEQPVVTPDVGQKRSADQMESGSQNQLTYNYQQQMPTSYAQQVPTGSVAYQQNQAMTATAYQQQTAVPPSGYQMQPTVQPYQQQPAATGFQQPVPATVSTVPVGDGYQQQQSVPAAAVFQPVAQGQAVNAPVYDYNKRPRF